MKQLKILYKFPTKGRPERFQKSIESIYKAQKDSVICVTIDEDDSAMSEHLKKNSYDAFFFTGLSKNKIHAINRDLDKIAKFHWDILICWSDDMIIQNDDFESIVSNCFYENNQLNLDLFVHLPDGHQNEKICTLSIMGREYFNRFNYIYHPDYTSVYADNEATQVAKMLGCYRYFPIPAYEHIHPANGYAFWDMLYERNETPVLYANDFKVFSHRQNNSFYLNV
jgi:hypothetical protein